MTRIGTQRRLITVGWISRRIGSTEQAFIRAETSRRRVVSVDERAGTRSDPAAQFARSFTTLAAAGAAERRDCLPDLVRLLSDNAPVRQPKALTWRTWDVPGLLEHLQPIPKIRAA